LRIFNWELWKEGENRCITEEIPRHVKWLWGGRRFFGCRCDLGLTGDSWIARFASLSIKLAKSVNYNLGRWMGDEVGGKINVSFNSVSLAPNICLRNMKSGDCASWITSTASRIQEFSFRNLNFEPQISPFPSSLCFLGIFRARLRKFLQKHKFIPLFLLINGRKSRQNISLWLHSNARQPKTTTFECLSRQTGEM
jgi:hypothetical protein